MTAVASTRMLLAWPDTTCWARSWWLPASSRAAHPCRLPLWRRRVRRRRSQLPLPTTVRWAVDKGSPDDPQHRSLLVLFYDGNARGWRIIDPNGDLLFHVPIAGSGIFGPETCVARARRFDEVTTWIALDRPTLELFLERYRTLRGVAEGIPAGEVTLSLSDSGCRG